MFSNFSFQRASLDAAGLVALADLLTISKRTVLTGTASMLDAFVLAPGIHCQQKASELNGGELPTASAMTTGYVFRIENPATVCYLQSIGETGHLVEVRVEKYLTSSYLASWLKIPVSRSLFVGGIFPAILYLLSVALAIVAFLVLGIIFTDLWAIIVLSMLVIARIINVVVIRRRAEVGWKGVPEPGEFGDLLVLLSQDRWVRMRGLVHDLKVVTAGQWLRDETRNEGFFTALSTLLVYCAAALAGNASTPGSLIIACLLLITVALLGLSNSLTRKLQMFGRIVYVEGRPKYFERRLHMAEELITSSGRSDWAIQMGLIKPEHGATLDVISS